MPIALSTAAVRLGEIVVSPGRFGVIGDASVRQQQELLPILPTIGFRWQF